uniref:Uncharacterized protein n=1 Tax=viral metagenome TaxID=1070528 RepID=A0A6C0KVG5_9ZZZZ
MDSLSESSNSSKPGFFKHVFNFEDDSKSEILNIIQYSLIAIIPIVLLNKGMQKFVPEADEEKGSLELLAEVVIQIIIMFLGILLTNRIITYIPTYSGTKYPEFSVTYIILAVLVITLSLQTKLGEKVSILVDRVMDLWDGKKDDKKKKKNSSGNVKVTQPISQPPSSASAMTQSLYTDSTPINQLPQEQQQQQMPDYNSMYRNDATQMVGASTPGGAEAYSNMGPVAANEALGGAFGSNF